MKKNRMLNIILFCMLLLSIVFQLNTVSAQINRGTAVSVETLPSELKGMDIKDYFLPASSKEVGIIHALQNNVVVTHKGNNGSYFGKEGDVLYENDMLNTLDESRCRIKMLNDDVITLAAKTSFSIESYSDDKEDGKKKSLFSMAKGKAMFYAMRLFKYKEAQLELKTPTAVVGVRGTKFGVNVYEQFDKSAGINSAGIMVADAGRDMGQYLAQAGPQNQIITEVTSGDGQVIANGNTVNPGEVYSTETNIVTYDPTAINTIESDTEIQTGAQGEQKAAAPAGEEGTETDTIVASGGEEPIPQTIADINETNTDTTTTETGTTTETTTATATYDISQGKTGDEISGIAAAITCDAKTGFAYYMRDGSYNITKGPLYAGGPNVFTGGAETHKAYEDYHDDEADRENYKMVVQEQSDTNMDMNVTYFDWGSGTNTADNVTQHTFKWNPKGSFSDENGKEYMSWGWWEDPSATDTGLIGIYGQDYYHVALGKVFEVEGYRTHGDYIQYLQDNKFFATYSNPDGAHGVYVSSDWVGKYPTELNGEVSFDVNFGTREVTNFHIFVQGQGGVSAEISGGHGIIDSSGEFDIDDQNVPIRKINGSPADWGGGGGVFMGPKANGAAGGWEVGNGDWEQEQWAVGGFYTERGDLHK